MSFIKIKIKGLVQVKRKIESEADRFSRAIANEVLAAGEMIKAVAQINLQKGTNSPYGKPTSHTGNLAGSIESVSESGGSRAVIGSTLIYAGIIERGFQGWTRMPNVEAISRWAELKLGDASAGFPIAKKILERGVPAQPYLEPAFNEVVPEMIKRMKKIRV